MMRPNPISTVVFLFGVVSALFALYAWSYRNTRGSRMFAFFLGAMTLYVVGYSFELASVDLETMLFWSKIEYLGIFSFPTLFLIFVFQYTGHDAWLTPRNLLFLFIIPVIGLILKFTDDTFHLIYANSWIHYSGTIPLLGFRRGPLYPVVSYSILPVTLGIILLFLKRQNTLPLYRKQATLVAVSALLPLIVFILYLSNIQLIPELKYFDLNAFAYPLWGIGLMLAVFRYQLFSIAPAAREALIEHMSDGVFVLDHQNHLVDVNPIAQKIIGWDDPPIGQDVRDILASLHDRWKIDPYLSNTEITHQEISRAVGDEEKFYDMTITPLMEKKKFIGHLIVMHDITRLKKLEAELLELTLVDELTGLSNRRGFFVLAPQFLRMVKRIDSKAAVVFIDLDTMKMINDTYGHAEGDEAIIRTAEILRGSIRASDILARFGGDEFVALVLETREDGAEKMFTRIDARFAEFSGRKNQRYPIGISYGIAHYDPHAPQPLETLVSIADKAMYAQKQSKKA